MHTNAVITAKTRTVAALALLFFVIYCSVGVCTNLFGSAGSGSATETTVAAVDHSAHAGHSAQAQQAELAAHCDSTEKPGCNWSLNPVADPVSDLDTGPAFFTFYLVATGALLLIVALYQLLSGPHRFAFAREQYYLCGYPRRHLQHAVFLN